MKGVDIEIIVIDDGSTDDTAKVIQSCEGCYDQFVRLERNLGKGGAVKEGLMRATGDYILFQDADLEYDPNQFNVLLYPVLAFNADLVIGSRMLAPEYTRVHYFWHKAGNKFLTLFFNVLFNSTFTDIYSCYLLYRRSLVDPGVIQSIGWEQHAEILAEAVQNGRDFYEVPINYHGRTYEEGKKIRAVHIISVLLMFLKKRLFRTQKS